MLEFLSATKLDFHCTSQARATPGAIADGYQSIAHIFFNQRPLYWIRRTTSSLLITGGSSTPPVADFLQDTEKAAELTALERVEILQYDEIRFGSSLAVKRSRRNGKIQNDMPVHRVDVATPVEEPDNLPTQMCNDGYDDELGDYLVLMGDHLVYRGLSALGQGSFGQVICCLDHRTSKHVAIKIIRNRRKYRYQALVELQ
ncbi:CMGC/DYRK/DYRK2 protein Kinase [Phytophthora palmivora]|uniref:CMGC/DYRK/DYRK2 protein Kinase n=1 Tax=Phytophthora palmivora TaxID=4796 RepID=A0A2P4YQI6_9STRA|nr:CMGC/DYRK/DYRK2 protein Kinase [Phytophthora palmivora]